VLGWPVYAVVGVTESEKSGNSTLTNAGCVPTPVELVPVTAIIWVPAGLELVVETVRVEVCEPEIEAGLKLAVTPVGAARTFAERVTLPVNPFPGVSEIVAVPGAPPGVKLNVAGDADKLKNAVVVETGASALIVPCPFGVPHPVTMSKPVRVEKPSDANCAGTVEPLGLQSVELVGFVDVGQVVTSWNAAS
jgi:hypothetical protein